MVAIPFLKRPFTGTFKNILTRNIFLLQISKKLIHFIPAFGLGTMIWTGLEIGTFFEIPLTSPCHQILRGVNPLLQMIFTFMQMYFIFMNSRVILNIHRFKVIARFGLMHVVATNICVWIRTLVMETLKEITIYYRKRVNTPEQNVFLESLRQNIKENEGLVMGTEMKPIPPDSEWEPVQLQVSRNLQEANEANVLQRIVQTTTDAVKTTLSDIYTTKATNTPVMAHTAGDMIYTMPKPTTFSGIFDFLTTSTISSSTTTEKVTVQDSTISSILSTTTQESTDVMHSMIDDISYMNFRKNDSNNLDQAFESLESLFPESLTAMSTSSPNATSCGKIDIMGTIVQDSSPYLYPFIIEYSLIGAVVIYVMWKHIGRYQK